jgi:hypothetical protein
MERGACAAVYAMERWLRWQFHMFVQGGLSRVLAIMFQFRPFQVGSAAKELARARQPSAQPRSQRLRLRVPAAARSHSDERREQTSRRAEG